MTPPPAPITEVRIAVIDAGVPVSGIAVVFQAADDTIVAERVTDASGIAFADLPNGGTVTAIRTAIIDGEKKTTAFTYAGVKAGDQLVLGNPVANGTAPVTVKLTVPTPDPEAGIGAYTVITPCGTATGVAPTIEIKLDGCGPETDFFVVDQNLGSFLAHRAIAPTIDLSAETVRGNRETTLTATNIPDGVSVALEKRLLTAGFLLFASGEVPIDTTTSVPDIGLAPADQLVVAGVADPAVGLTYTVAARSAYNNGTATVDLADTLVPAVSEATFDGTSVAWTQTGDGLPDLAVVTLTEGSLTRVISGPYASAVLRVPALPGISLTVDALISVSVARATGGYDAVRARVHGKSLLEAAPLDGRIAISTDGKR